ncbi:MAG: iron chelate uptake ABC transporter family permease subunit [Clostridium sp.]
MSIASVKGRITSTQLVLAGIATSALFSALTNLIVYGFNNGSDKTKMALYWMVGSHKRSYLEPREICVHRVCCYDGSDSALCAGVGHSSSGR